MAASEPDADVVVTEADVLAARERVRAVSRGQVPLGIGLVAGLNLAAAFVTEHFFGSVHGAARAVIGAAIAVGLCAPFFTLASASAKRRGSRDLAATLAGQRLMREETGRREFETRLVNALEMADTEDEAVTVVARAIPTGDSGVGIELLVADNSHAHMQQAFVVGRDASGPGCPVGSPGQCMAIRRGQTQRFDDSDAFDACPKLQNRPAGRVGAVCVPVTITGRSVGVLHLTEPVPVIGDEGHLDAMVDRAEVLSNQIGNRLGMLRMMADSHMQASTDSLTGLANRRSFENEIRHLRQTGIEHCVVMADLDNFKAINDTHGHEGGDRALRIFARIVRDAVRPEDLVCRYGGDEVAMALPACTTNAALRVCERIREDLALALANGDQAAFTASFGIAGPARDLPFEQQLAQADTALYQAKLAGRNRTVIHEPLEAGVTQVSGQHHE